MSKAKDEYYRFKKIADESFGGQVDDIENYVTELEEQNEEIIKSLNDVKYILSKCMLEPCDYVRKRCNDIIDGCICVFEEENPNSLTTGFVDKNSIFQSVGCVEIYKSDAVMSNNLSTEKEIRYIVPEKYNYEINSDLSLVIVDAIMKHLGIRL